MTEKRPFSLGSFDLFKGIGILGIIACHVIEIYPIDNVSILMMALWPLYVVRGLMMQAFFVISGYGFRKRSLKNFYNTLFMSIIKPYYIVTVLVVVIHFGTHCLFFRLPAVAFAETVRLFVGFLFGFPVTYEYFGQLVYSCGPAWYLMALAVSSLLLTVVMNCFDEKKVPYVVGAGVLAGYFLGKVIPLPFCLNQSLICMGCLYLGYLMKKYRVFRDGLPKYWALVVFALYFIPHFFSFGHFIGVLHMDYPLGLFSLVSSCLASCVLVYWCAGLSGFKNKAGSFLSNIGFNSLFMYCAHSIEDIAFPWYLFVAKYNSNVYLSMLTQYFIRAALIIIAAMVAKKTVIQLKRQKVNA